MTALTHEVLAMAVVMKIITDSAADYTVKRNPIDKKGRKLYPIVESLDRLMQAQATRLERFAVLMRQAKQHREPSLEDLLSEPEPSD